MSKHLTDRVYDLLTPEVIDGIADGAAESSETARSAAEVIAPALLLATTRFAEQPSGGVRLMGLLHEGGYDRFDRRELAGRISSPHARTQLKLEGSRLLDRILAGRRLEITEALGAETGLSSPTTGRLMSLSMPIVMGAVGSVAIERGLDAPALVELLVAEEPAMARGLSGEVERIAGGRPVPAARVPGVERPEPPKKGPRSGVRSWLFAAALAILAVIVLPQMFPGTRNPFHQDLGPGPEGAETGEAETYGERVMADEQREREEREAEEARARDGVKGKPAGEALEPTEIEAASVEDAARYLESDEEGVRRFELSELHFESGAAKLSEGASEQLDRLAELVSSHPKVVVLVTGRADAEGEAAKNRELAMQRARAVAGRLVEGGVESRRVRVLSAGETEAAEAEGADVGERIVEVTLVKSDEPATTRIPRY